MTGTLLAIILSPLLTLALAFVLLRHRSAEKLPDAPRKQKRHDQEYITREQLDEALEEVTRDLNYEWNEWYEKFDKLHLRLAKRAKRAEKQEEVDQEELGFDAGERPSVLHFRRVGSV